MTTRSAPSAHTSGNAPTGPTTRAEQLVWVLLTGSEFRFNH